jgi:soluble lytic murein transglycosylase-like protein
MQKASKEEVKEEIIFASRAYDIDAKLLEAIVAVESDYDNTAIRYEPNYAYTTAVSYYADIVGCTRETMLQMQKTSWGLVQLIAANAYSMGLKCYATMLIYPKINLKYGCLYIKRMQEKQQLIEPDQIYAAYNHGHLKRNDKGDFINQKNVDRFLKIYKSI